MIPDNFVNFGQFCPLCLILVDLSIPVDFDYSGSFSDSVDLEGF